MYTALIIAFSFTLGVSAFCSLLEAFILSTTTVEIEELKKNRPQMGKMLETFKTEIEETSSAILALNTIANTCGATFVGGLAAKLWGENRLTEISILLAICILFFSEILPKNIGVIYRKNMQTTLIYPLWIVRIVMFPLSMMGKGFVRLFISKKNTLEGGDEHIILMAQKGAKDGVLTEDESAMISNALSLDNVIVQEIMTPRTVMFGFEKDMTMREIADKKAAISFARLPVYEDNIDTIVGVVRRRDILKAIGDDEYDRKISDLMQKTIFIPENASGTAALQTFLKSHQQLGIAVDEFGSVSGVITMEDVIEHILGQEIFEKDDMAIDMRELARQKRLAANSNGHDEDH